METFALSDDRIQQTYKYVLCQLPEKAMESAQFAHKLLDEILIFIKPGMKESEIGEFISKLFVEHKVERIWHQPYIRFGNHTLLTYKDKAEGNYILGEEDIAFVDIGIVKAGIEGDAGRSIVFGNSTEHHGLQAASEEIFQQAKQFWKQNDPTGIELYEHIHLLADKMDVEFNLDPAGHLIGEFPHRGWKKGINHYPEKIVSGCWILEIQICNASREYGAFYEDLLY